MKKTLVAIAALAATGAFAQTTVAITGGMDAGYQQKSYSNGSTDANLGTATRKWSGIAGSGDYTSQFNFQGTQELGGGMKAGFWGELDVNPASSSAGNTAAGAFQGTPFTGQQYVSIEGGFGSLKVGQPNSPALIAGIMMNPTKGGTNLGSGYSGSWGRLGNQAASGVNTVAGNTVGRIVRHEKTVNYSTPTVNGFTGTVEYSWGNNNAPSLASTSVATATGWANTNSFSGLALAYNNGPLNAMAYHGEAKNGGATAPGVTTAVGTFAANALGNNGETKWNMLAANYTLGATTIYGGYTTTKATGTTTANSLSVLEDSKSTSIAAKYALSGTTDLWVNYVDRKSNFNDSTAAATATTSGAAASITNANFNINNPHSKLKAVGANYNLSKTSYLYATYETISNVSVTSGDSKITALGLVVKF